MPTMRSCCSLAWRTAARSYVVSLIPQSFAPGNNLRVPCRKPLCNCQEARVECQSLIVLRKGPAVSLRVLRMCRCDNKGSIGREDTVRGAAMHGSAQLAKPHWKLEARLLRPCAVETDSRRQAAARWAGASIAAWPYCLPNGGSSQGCSELSRL